MKQRLMFFLLVTILLTLASCSEEGTDVMNIPIKSARATTSVDLTERGDWSFYINGKQYHATINGRTIHAVPLSPEQMSYITYYPVDGKMPSINITEKTVIAMYFVAPNYPLREKGPSFQLPRDLISAASELLDQSTLSKMHSVDALSLNHQCNISSHIENARLEHSHSLVDFTLESMPEGAKVELLTASEIVKPYVEEGLHQAILINPHLASISVKVNGKTYVKTVSAEISKLPVEMRSARDMHYNFVVKYNEAKSEEDEATVTIEDITGVKWSQEDLDKK